MGRADGTKDDSVVKDTSMNGHYHSDGEQENGHTGGPERVRAIVVPESRGEKGSELYVDADGLEQKKQDAESEVVRLDPDESGKIPALSSSQYVETPSTKLQVSSTMPSGQINLILDENEKEGTVKQPGTEPPAGTLERTESAPGLSCLDPKSAAFEDSKKRLVKEKSKDKVRKHNWRKREKLLKRIGSIVDGTIQIDENESFTMLSDLLDEHEDQSPPVDIGDKKIPPLQIAMLIVGTRGDVQPFVAIGKELQKYGHRVRLATHKNFKDFVQTAGLEFYPLGGDPKVLAGYMVKNKGFLPSNPKEIRLQRKQIKAIVNSLYPACIEPDQDSGVAFKAQAIISNPPAYGHVHVAEALGVPIHIFFTMPWTPTNEFPHPLSRISSPTAYKLSYQVVDMTIWLGIRSLINDFRKRKLKLRPVSYLGRNSGSISNLPTCYMWSPCLVPKPKDWGPRVDVVGYCFLELASDYKPPEDLVRWLEAGSAPIYIGFGSLPVEDPEGMRDIIIKAMEQTGQRGLIDKGWGGIADLPNPPEFVRFIENCPHDWLFPQCTAVVHHGGAGTTAAGLKAACPTTIVPFFGDQPFWGEQVHKQGIGPSPIPVKHFSLDKLVDSIKFMLSPEVKQKAEEMAKCILAEDGVANAVKAFYKQLPEVMPVSEPPKPKPGFWSRQMCC